MSDLDTQEVDWGGRRVTIQRTTEVRFNDPLPAWLSKRQAAKGNNYARLEQAWVVLPPDDDAGKKVWAPVHTVRPNR